MLTFLQNHKKSIFFFAGLVAFFALIAYTFLRIGENRVRQPVRMNYEDTVKKETVKDRLRVDDKSAGQIVRQVERIHDRTMAPPVTYYVTAPTVATAADKTAEQIRRADASLPPAAVAKSDRTIVTADEQRQKVDVYKINLRNNHKIKAGVSYIDGHEYLSTGYQAGRIEGIVHIGQNGRSGGTVLYTINEW